MELEEEDVEEVGVTLPDQKSLSVGYVGEKSTCQKDVSNPNTSYVTKRGILHNSALGNQ